MKLRNYKTSEVCKLLGVSRSEYYRIAKEQDNEEKELEKAVINCFEKHKGNYGRIRIRKELLGKGINISGDVLSIENGALKMEIDISSGKTLTGATTVVATGIDSADSYKELDFETVWTITNAGPVLAQFQ